MNIKFCLLLFGLIALVSDAEPAPHKNDPFKPVYRILKELRKAQKYKYKYGGGGYRGGDDSDESSEENYGGPFNNNRPNGNGGNRPSLFPSLSGLFGGNNNNNNNGGGGGQRQPSTGSTGSGGGLPGGNGGGLPGGNGGGGGSDPLAQLNQGLSGALQGLGSLTLGQLVQGSFNFPSS